MGGPGCYNALSAGFYDFSVVLEDPSWYAYINAAAAEGPSKLCSPIVTE